MAICVLLLSLPQAITVAELYGVLDPDTRDWTDGLLSNIFREINKSLAEGKDEARQDLVSYAVQPLP